MKMDEMNKSFEAYGFEVIRGYDPTSESYEFTLRKDGIELTVIYKWPNDQHIFISNTIQLFKQKKTEYESGSTIHYRRYGYAPVRNAGASNGPEIKNVIFNDPATIVFWSDGTKTVVKCQDGDEFNPEVGLAMAIAKKAFGNKGNYCNEFKKWLPKETLEDVKSRVVLHDLKQALDHCTLRWEADNIRLVNMRSKVQRAYHMLGQFQNDGEVPNKTLNDVLRYLSDALED